MKTLYAWALLTLLLVGCAGESDVATVEPADPIATQPEVVVPETELVDTQQVFEGIVGEYNEALKRFEIEYKAATTRAERTTARQDFYPDVDGYASRLMQVLANDPDASISFDALAWVVGQAVDESILNTAIQQLAEKHIENPKLAGVCRSLGRKLSRGVPTLKAVDFLNAVLERNPDHATQAWACSALAVYHSGLVKTNELIETYPDYGASVKSQLGEAVYERFAGLDKNKTEEICIALYEKLVSEFGDVDSDLAAAAESKLFELKFLSIGKEAPDIVGNDVDGEAFKLSDYRGKVVFLDFWGDW